MCRKIKERTSCSLCHVQLNGLWNREFSILSLGHAKKAVDIIDAFVPVTLRQRRREKGWHIYDICILC